MQEAISSTDLDALYLKAKKEWEDRHEERAQDLIHEGITQARLQDKPHWIETFNTLIIAIEKGILDSEGDGDINIPSSLNEIPYPTAKEIPNADRKSRSTSMNKVTLDHYASHPSDINGNTNEISHDSHKKDNSPSILVDLPKREIKFERVEEEGENVMIGAAEEEKSSTQVPRSIPESSQIRYETIDLDDELLEEGSNKAEKRIVEAELTSSLELPALETQEKVPPNGIPPPMMFTKVSARKEQSLNDSVKSCLKEREYYITHGTLFGYGPSNAILVAVRVVHIQLGVRMIHLFPIITVKDQQPIHMAELRLAIPSHPNKGVAIIKEIESFQSITTSLEARIKTDDGLMPILEKLLDLHLSRMDQWRFGNANATYLVNIAPIVVSPTPPTFDQPDIPYAFHRSTNLHIIDVESLPDLVAFLEHKGKKILPWKASIHSQSVNLPIDTAHAKMFKMVKSSSLGLLVYLTIFGCLIFGRVYELYALFRTISVIAFTIYIGLAGGTGGYYYWRTRAGSEISSKGTVRFKWKELLDLVKEEFTPTLFRQLYFECEGKLPSIHRDLEVAQGKENTINAMESPGEDVPLLASDYNLELMEKYKHFLDD
jgi:hypothetical protein